MKGVLKKELLELRWYALGFLVLVVGVQRLHSAESLFDPARATYASLVYVLAAALGLRQSLTEARGGLMPALLVRPARRERLLAVKLVAGLGLLWTAGALPVLAHGWWASVPGHLGEPFCWAMLTPFLNVLIVAPTIYLGALLTGWRRAGWPMLAVTAVFAFAPVDDTTSVWLAVLYAAVLAPLLTWAALCELRGRDWS